MSNYPPGVTGNEYAIGGAEAEWSEEETCPHCDWTGEMDHEKHYEFGIRAFCANPDEPTCVGREGFEIEPDEPDYYAYDYMDEEDRI